jgi:mRNA interferase MazF
MPPQPKRGELYAVNLNPTIGHEQRGQRPVLVVSIEAMNGAPAELVIAVPLTTTDRANKLHVRITPGENGLTKISYAMPEMVRHLSILRLGRRLGRVPVDIVDTAARHSGLLIGLGEVRY